MHALNLCFISDACFIAVPTNTEDFNFFLHLSTVHVAHALDLKTLR